MSVVRRDKGTVRRVGPRRVGTGMVALLALGTGAGCGQSLLRSNVGPGIAAESLGQADMATPSRRLAWVGPDGRRDLPLTAALPPREPDRLNAGLEPAIVASATTWNGWKVPLSKGRASEPAALASGIPLMEVSEPVAASPSGSAIPMPSTRLAGNDAEIERLLAASRDTKIAPPLKRRVAKPEIMVAQAPAPPLITVVDVLPAPASEPSTPKVEREERVPSSAAVAVIVDSRSDAEAVKSSAPSEPAGTTPVTAPLAETSPQPAPTAPAPVQVEMPRSVTVTQAEPPVADRDTDKPVAMAPLDPALKPVIVASAPVEAPTGGLPADEPQATTPIPQPSEIDALALAAESTRIPLPKRPEDADVSTVSASEPTADALVEETVADANRPTDIPMPVYFKTMMPAPSVPEKTSIPMPNPPVTVDFRSTNIPMPMPRVTAPEEDPAAAASRTTNIPMPNRPYPLSANAPLNVDYGTTNIPMPIPPETATEEDPVASASRATNIPMPIPVAAATDDALSEASRTTNIPMPVRVSKPESVVDSLIEASRSTKIPLPIPSSDPK